MDLSQFNQKLSSFIRDAKLLEKTDPKKARVLWLKIAQYALEFSKKSGIDRDFKISLWRQIDGIIKKVKAEEIASGRDFSDTEESEGDNDKSNLTAGMDASARDIDFSSLPSVPKDGEDDIPVKPNLSKVDLASKKDQNKPSNIQQNKGKPLSFFEQIQNMENELKQMPEIFKEVPAIPFDPKKTIIKPVKDINPQDHSEVVNIQKVGKDIFGDTPIDLGTDSIDPYKGTKDFNEIKDPFGPAGIDQSINELNVTNHDEKVAKNDFIFCKECGFKLPTSAIKCSKCGHPI
jgi:hypothetical protein